MSSIDAKGLFQTDPCSKNQWAPGIQLGVNFPKCSRAAILDHPWAEREREREREMQQIRDRAYSAQATNSSLQQQGYYHKHSRYSCHSPCGRLLQWFLLLCHVLEYWTQNKFFTFAHSLTAQPQNLLRKKKRKQEKKTLKVKIKQLFNNMNCTKLVHLQLQKLRCIDSKAATSVQPKPTANQLL